MPAHRTRIKDLLAAESSGDITGPVNVKGWVKTVRSSGGVAFVQINDGSTWPTSRSSSTPTAPTTPWSTR